METQPEPPSYTFSGPTPGYRPVAEEAEVTLQHTPRWRGVDNSSEPETFNKSWTHGVNVTLRQYQKDEYSHMPVYTRNSVVSGEVEVFDRDTVLEVIAVVRRLIYLTSLPPCLPYYS